MADARYRLPAEWEEQSGVMLTWPHPDTDWAADLEAVEGVYTAIARAIADRERLLVVCADRDHGQRVLERLSAAGIRPERVLQGFAPSDDTWARDHGPLAVLDRSGQARLLDFRFNGWGAKFPFRQDDAITSALYAQGCFAHTPFEGVGLVLEGGAVETDGQGTLLATLSSVVKDTRNPGLGRDDLECRLGELLGLERFLWLNRGGLSGDDTDGHIDTLARFADPLTLVHVTCRPGDPDEPELGAMIGRLRDFRTADGSPYRLVALPAPAEHRDTDGRRLPASYANFLLINGAVLVPTYDDPADRAALEILADCFPGRAPIPIACRSLIRQNGSLHCVAMQLAAGVDLGPRARA
jgi:agmatine/peptidylarginine deiminase